MIFTGEKLKMLSNEILLITGGTGSFGKTMLKSLLDTSIQEIRVFSRDEEKQDAMRAQINDSRIKYYIGDVRDRRSVENAMVNVDRVFHAAALKQVPSCEFFPMQAVKTNVIGSQNVIEAAVAAGAKSLVMLSTDKAVQPINAMGMSKALMEKVALAKARDLKSHETIISVVRYGNVMYSRGSVIPLFANQILSGQDLTITEESMTRFLMPLRDSVSLVLHAFQNAKQGDIFVQKAPASTVGDLAAAMCEVLSYDPTKIRKIGWRHGEKLYETLIGREEIKKAIDEGIYIRIPADTRTLNYEIYEKLGFEDSEAEEFNSHNTYRMTIQEVKELLLSLPEIQSLLKGLNFE